MRFSGLIRNTAGIAGALAVAALPGCTPSEQAAQTPVLDPAAPAAQDVLPRHAALLDGPPMQIDPGVLAGVWRSGACRLELYPGNASGAARVSGECPAALSGVADWRLEPVQRMRIDLLSEDEDALLWSGLMTGPDRLTGHAGSVGGWVWTRDAARASTPGG